MDESITWTAAIKDLFKQGVELEEIAAVGYPKLGMLRSAVAEMAAGWRRFAQEVRELGPQHNLDRDTFSIVHSTAADSAALLRAVRAESTEDDFQGIARNLQTLSANGQIVASVLSKTLPNDQHFVLDLKAAIDQVSQNWRQIEQELERERSAAASIRRLQTMVEEAQEATGVVGQGALSDAFDELSGEEKATAVRFRYATFALIALSLVALVVPSIISAFGISSGASPDSPGSLIGRLAISAVIGGAAAYCARQASHHRRIHVWARSISTQLRSLNAFIAPITDDGVRNAVIDATARRMLSEPPQSGKQTENQADTTSLLQLAVDLARRPSA